MPKWRWLSPTGSATCFIGTRSPRSCSAAPAPRGPRDQSLSLGIIGEGSPARRRALQARAQGRRLGGHVRRQARRRDDHLRPRAGRASAAPLGVGDGHRHHRPRGDAQQRAGEGPIRSAGADRRATRRLALRRGDAQARRRDARPAVRRSLLHRADGERAAVPQGLHPRRGLDTSARHLGAGRRARSSTRRGTTRTSRCAARRRSSWRTSPRSATRRRRGARPASAARSG